MDGRAKILQLQTELVSKLVERREVVHGVVLALVAREHVLMLGPPGTAKSLVAALVCQALGGGYFSILLTRFTTPDEVFGPVSLKGLEEDRYERKVTGYAPTARLLFVDEVYKASSAILNSLLTLLNERVFDNGGRRYACPLETCIAASNELPQDASLGALHDRFLLRYSVPPLSEQGARQLLTNTKKIQVKTRLTPEELAHVQTVADRVTVPQDVLEALLRIRQEVNAAGVYVSDRRLLQLRGLLRASAALSGRATADKSDLHVLAPALWVTPDQIEQVRRIVVSKTS